MKNIFCEIKDCIHNFDGECEINRPFYTANELFKIVGSKNYNIKTIFRRLKNG